MGAALLYMAVFGAVISYLMQCLSFVLLRRKCPNIERPYRSPFGEAGAAVAGVIALLRWWRSSINDDYRPGVYGVLLFYLIAMAYFAIAGRHRLVLSPEEEFAMTRGEEGHPERGYGHTRLEALESGIEEYDRPPEGTRASQARPVAPGRGDARRAEEGGRRGQGGHRAARDR